MTKIEKLKNGDYTIKLDLETGREYQLRFANIFKFNFVG